MSARHHSTSLVQAPNVKYRAWQAVCSCGWLGLVWVSIGGARNEGDKHERDYDREAS